MSALDGIAGHLAVPSGSGPWPGVVMIHEIIGLTDDMRRQADRLAAHGYLTIAVDLFDGRPLRCLVSTMRGLLSGQGGAALERIEAARVALGRREDCTGKVGVVGFCMGGGFAILAAGRYDFDAAAPNYGALPRDAEQVLAGACPIVASYGGKDLTLRGTAARLEATLGGLGIDHDVKEYPHAAHGFMTPHTGRWAFAERLPGLGGPPADADDAWRRLFAFFDTHLREAQSPGGGVRT